MCFQIQLRKDMFNKIVCVSKVNKKRMDLFTTPRGRARDALARGDGVTSSGNGRGPM